MIYARIAPHIFAQLDECQRGFRWGADVMTNSLLDTLGLRQNTHTFVAFVDIKKAFDSSWVEATMVRLYDVGISGRMWHLIANFLCGTLSRIRIGDSASQPFVDSSIAQGLVLSTLLFNVLVDLAASIRSVVPGVRLVPSDAYRHTCQFYADDVVLLSESQIDLQAGCMSRLGHSLALHLWCGPNKVGMVFGPVRSLPDCLGFFF